MDLVTGGCGYLGLALVRKLVERGHRVRVLDLAEADDIPAGVEFIKADICDRKAVAKSLEGVETVYHTVARVPLTKSHRNFWEVNVGGTRVAVEESLRKGVRAFVHTSSSAIFGAPRQFPILPDTPPSPVEAYGTAKLAAEREVEKGIRNGLCASMIRPRTIIGRERLGIFGILFDWIERGKRVWIIGSGDNLFQFIHFDDLVDVMIRAGEGARKGIFNVGTDRFGTLREDLEALVKYADTGSRIASLPVGLSIALLRILDHSGLSPLAPWHYLTYHKPFFFDLQKTMEELDWTPRWGNVEMLRESYDWFRSRSEDQSGQSIHRSPVSEGILGLLKRLS